MSPTLDQRTRAHEAIRARVFELLDDDGTTAAIVATISAEFGVTLAPQAVGYWRARYRQSPATLPARELSPAIVARIEADAAASRRALAARPHRCAACLGVSGGERCEWCGAAL